MNRPAMSLMDIIAPPGNRWLTELSRRKGTPPPGVRVVRFGSEDDDSGVATDTEETPSERSGRQPAISTTATTA